MNKNFVEIEKFLKMEPRTALRIHLSKSTFKGLSLFDGYLMAERGGIEVKASKHFKRLNKCFKKQPDL